MAEKQKGLVERLELWSSPQNGDLRALLQEAADRIVELQKPLVPTNKFASSSPDNSQTTRELKAIVANNHIARAYLFSGPWQYSTNMVVSDFAKDILCSNNENGWACGYCDQCEDLAMGICFDFKSLDAKYNGSVSDFRDVVSTLALGTPGRKKVIRIGNIDRMAMGAGEALIKILKEPPEHVVFLLSTTKVTDVPLELRSLCQNILS